MQSDDLENKLFSISHHAPLRSASLVVMDYFHIRGTYNITSEETFDFLVAKYVGKNYNLKVESWYANKYKKDLKYINKNVV